MDQQADKTVYRIASPRLKKVVVKIRISKQSGSRLNALNKLLNVILVTRIHKMRRTQSDLDEKNMVNDISIQVCFDRF